MFICGFLQNWLFEASQRRQSSVSTAPCRLLSACVLLSTEVFWREEDLSTSLLAGVDIIDSYTLLTADIAAPVENAVTLLLPLLSPSVVASAAAQQVTPVYAVGRQVADAIPSAEGAGLWVGFTEIRRAFIVNQVTLRGWFEVVVLGSQGLHPSPGLPVFFHHHLRGAIVLVFHVVTDDSEVGLRPPARLHFAAAGEPVALTPQKHVAVEGLEN